MIVLVNRGTATFLPASRCVIMPEPTTYASNNSVPNASATTRRASVCFIICAYANMLKFIFLKSNLSIDILQNYDKIFVMVSMQTFFTALADRTRRRILNLIRDRELCVCFFTEILDISQPKISRHLAYLRNAEIVTSRRDGKWMYYRIIEPEDSHAAQILHDTLDWLASEERMQKDYEKLNIISSSPNAPVQISRALPSNILLKADVLSWEREELDTFLL